MSLKCAGRLLRGAALLLSAALAAAPLGAGVRFEVGTAFALPGGEAEVSVYLSNDAPLQGLSVGLLYESSILRLKRIAAVRRDHFEFYTQRIVPDFAPGLGLGIAAIIVDLEAPFTESTLPPGERQPVFVYRFELKADPALLGTCTPLVLVEGGFAEERVQGRICFAAEGQVGEPAPSPNLQGDSNWDCGIDLADAAFTLEHLFLGGGAPGCPSSADFNLDGRLDITDAVVTLAFLFLGGPEPAPRWLPLPPPGPLGCVKAGCGVRATLERRGVVEVWVELAAGTAAAEIAARLERGFRARGDGVAASDCPAGGLPCDVYVLGLASPLPLSLHSGAVLDALEAMDEVRRLDRIRPEE